MSTSKRTKLFTTIDVETTSKDKGSGRFPANAFHPDNYVVAYGAMDVFDDGTREASTTGLSKHCKVIPQETLDLVVGQHFVFDLHHLRAMWKDDSFPKWSDKMNIWDTQIAEYVLSGQLTKMVSLDELAVLYGTTLKDGKVSKLFKEGVGADEIPTNTLNDYLMGDLNATSDVALKQMERATEQQFNLILEMGETLKAIQEMEWNGMAVDVGLCENRVSECLNRIHDYELKNKAQLTAHEGVDNLDNLLEFIAAKPDALNSNQVLSCFIFGGKVPYIHKEAVGVYKSGAKKGKIRYKNTEKFVEFPRQVDPDGITTPNKNKNKCGSVIYTVDEDVLEAVKEEMNFDTSVSTNSWEIVGRLLAIRKLSKVMGTYYQSFIDKHQDGILHHTLNQTRTSTGRLSSSDPNLQNVPLPGDDSILNVKDVFMSRFGPEGRILELDFKQLEVCGLAWLTKDPQLIKDIVEGVDIHNAVGTELGLDTSDKLIRRDVKSVVFAMIYGAGAKGIAKSTRLELGFVQGVIDAFYTRYSTVKDWYKALEEKIRDEGCRMDLIYRGEHGPEHYYEWQSPTGRTYMFPQDQYRPGPAYTKVRNYPVQGTATGDLVPCILSEIASVLRNEPGIRSKMITTTHDSVTFDCPSEPDAHGLLWALNKTVFKRMEDVINERLPGIDWDIPLTIEAEMGDTWGNMEYLDLNTIV